MESLSVNFVFSGGVQQDFRYLIFSSIKIGHFSHINFSVFGDESQDIQVINNQNIRFFNTSIVEFSINFDDG